jgi:expansin (peptidoglycan-binding protein)
MANAYFRLELKGELSAEEVSKTVAAQLLRVDTRKGKTTVYFVADKKDPGSKALRARASEVKLSSITTI